MLLIAVFGPMLTVIASGCGESAKPDPMKSIQGFWTRGSGQWVNFTATTIAIHDAELPLKVTEKRSNGIVIDLGMGDTLIEVEGDQLRMIGAGSISGTYTRTADDTPYRKEAKRRYDIMHPPPPQPIGPTDSLLLRQAAVKVLCAESSGKLPATAYPAEPGPLDWKALYLDPTEFDSVLVAPEDFRLTRLDRDSGTWTLACTPSRPAGPKGTWTIGRDGTRTGQWPPEEER